MMTKSAVNLLSEERKKKEQVEDFVLHVFARFAFSGESKGGAKGL